MNWEYLLQKFAKAFYTEPVMHLTGLLVIILFFFNPKKGRPMIYLAILALASFTQGILVHYDALHYKHTELGKNIEQTTIFIYLVTELTCCLLFIRAYLESREIKKALLLGNVLFFVFTIIYWRLHPSVKIYPWYITISEGALIIGASLCFFYELFSHKPGLILSEEPSFWAISGMLIVYSAITPLFLIFNYLRKADLVLTYKLYTINNVSYSLLFITFIITILLDQKKSSTFHYPNYSK